MTSMKIYSLLGLIAILAVYSCKSFINHNDPQIQTNDQGPEFLKFELYSLESISFEHMFKQFFDSCSIKYGCKSLEYISFSIHVGDEGKTQYYFTHGGEPYKYGEINSMACFQFNNTVVFAPLFQLNTHSFFDQSSRIGHISVQRNLKDKNQCLFTNISGESSKILLRMVFDNDEEEFPSVVSFVEYIE